MMSLVLYIFKIIMGMLSPLHFHMNFRISSLTYNKKPLRFEFPWHHSHCSLRTSSTLAISAMKNATLSKFTSLSWALESLTFWTSYTFGPDWQHFLELCGPAGCGWACLCVETALWADLHRDGLSAEPWCGSSLSTGWPGNIQAVWWRNTFLKSLFAVSSGFELTMSWQNPDPRTENIHDTLMGVTAETQSKGCICGENTENWIH